jgi:hypothetical protein
MRRFWPVLVVLFFAFEASRAVWLGEFLWPIWEGYAERFAAMPIPAQIVTLLAFLAQMVVFGFAMALASPPTVPKRDAG